MSGQRRRRLDMRSWREVMRRFDGAGATVGAFCAREGLSASSFYRWRERLGTGGEVGAAARPSQPAAPAVALGAAGFIDLGSLRDPPRDSAGGLELRLDLGGGLVLQIVRR